MASLTSSFSPSSPPSVSNSELSASQPTPPTPSHHQDGATDNGVLDALRQNPLSLDLYADMNSKEYIEKLSKYEADHICRVMAKYFSDKDIYGGKHLFGVSIQGLNLCFTCKTGYNQCQQVQNVCEFFGKEVYLDLVT
ncbi:hypothetical protein ACSBR1_024790 [Camellia fascicularis]